MSSIAFPKKDCWLKRNHTDQLHKNQKMRRQKICWVSALFMAIIALFFFAMHPNMALADVSASQGKIVIFGDCQHDLSILQNIVGHIRKEKPAAVFSVGDQVDNGENPKHWATFNRIMAPLVTSTPYYPAIGNHEKDCVLYFKNFPFLNNRRWYDIAVAGIQFIILDSESPLTATSPQFLWLKNLLIEKKDSADFIILIFHRPLFSTSAHHDEDQQQWRPLLLPLLKEYGVDIIFNGHAHNYERSYYDGTFHIVTSGAGSCLRDQIRQSPYSQVFEKKYHFCLLEYQPGHLFIKVIDVNDRTIDQFHLRSKRMPPPIWQTQKINMMDKRKKEDALILHEMIK